jgi:hypothetical protein
MSLKGISIAKRNSVSGGDFFLVLNRSDDWQIFLALCNDLISAAAPAPDEPSMILAVERRLRRWQQLLKSELIRPLSLQDQMGLFGELSCLKDILLSRVGPAEAVRGWRGPDADKQDFVLVTTAIEVKAYSSSKGPRVLISSLEQLWPDKDNFFLVAYGLTVVSTGQTVGDLASEILASLVADPETQDIFESKLGLYGYHPEIPVSDLERFTTDRVQAFAIDGAFPRMPITLVPPEIPTVQYSIDLSRCARFEKQIANIDLRI